MTILLDHQTADASRSIPRAEEAPARQLWANPARIVESRNRVQCACFVWNSEVGKRSVGIQAFWFQAVCQNHIVWDAVEVVEFSRKHTAKVHEAFSEIRGIVERLVAKRDERRDGFAKVIRKAMETQIGQDSDSVLKVLGDKGITRALAKEALEIARHTGRFTVLSLVDALTRISSHSKFAGERTDSDAKASALLALAAWGECYP